MSYRIREVDAAHDEEIAQEIIELDRLCFGTTAPPLGDLDLLEGHWWIVTCDWSELAPATPVAYAAVKQSSQWAEAGYLNRCGVSLGHRRQGLQRRLLGVRERKARRNGWRWLITDTTDNIASANSLIKAGYTLYRPTHPWAFTNTLYWRKELGT